MENEVHGSKIKYAVHTSQNADHNKKKAVD